jgi:hypothetical protein
MNNIRTWSLLTILMYWLKNVNITRHSREYLLKASMEIGLEENTKKTKNMTSTSHHIGGKN